MKVTPPQLPTAPKAATGQAQTPLKTEPLAPQVYAQAARLALGLTLPSPSGAALSRQLPPLGLDSLPTLLSSLLLPDKGQHQGLRQWLLAAVGARLQDARMPLPEPLARFLDSLGSEARKTLSEGLGRLEQAQVQSRQDTLFWALPLPFSEDWLELAWPKSASQDPKRQEEPVLTLLFPIPELGRLLVKAGVSQVRFYADTPALKARVDDTLPRLAKRLDSLNLSPALHSFQGKVPSRLMPPVGGINELV